MNRPPIGIPPRYIWRSRRLREITEAISRYTEALAKIPIEWIQEYNDLIKESETANE